MRMKITLLLLTGALALPVGARAAEAAAGPELDCSAALSQKVREMVEYLGQRGWIGIEFDDIEPPVITRIVAGGPAEAAGLEVGDQWLGVTGYEFAGKEREEAYKKIKSLIRPGADFTMVISRGGRRLELAITPVAVPAHIMAQWIGGHLLEKYASDLVPKDE